jgi:hypothetical protein
MREGSDSAASRKMIADERHALNGLHLVASIGAAFA